MLLEIARHHFVWIDSVVALTASSFPRLPVGDNLATKPSSALQSSSRSRILPTSQNTRKSVAVFNNSDDKDVHAQRSSAGGSGALWQLADAIALCLLQSDAKRNDGFDGASTGWTSWIHERASQRVQDVMHSITIKDFQTGEIATASYLDNRENDYDYLQRWRKWIQATPSPLILDATDQLRKTLHLCLDRIGTRGEIIKDAVAAPIDSDFLFRDEDESETTTVEPLSAMEQWKLRVGCHLLALPSGATLTQNLRTPPPGGLVFGTLLWGGATRYRVLVGAGGGSGRRRRAGERRVVVPPAALNAAPVPTEAWLQYGGLERNYQAVDMGPCLIMEVTILPEGLVFDTDFDSYRETIASGFEWSLDKVLQLSFANATGISGADEQQRDLPPRDDVSWNPSGDKFHGDIIQASTSFYSSLGGLRPQISEIIRRVLDGRVLARPPGELAPGEQDELSTVRLRREMQSLADLGLKPVRGLLLHGPPGCGKTVSFSAI